MTSITTPILLLLGLAVCGGCSSDKPALDAAGVATLEVATLEVPASQADVSACTGETQLIPGVPGSPGHYIDSSINPNGHSELAWLMRRMHADLGRVRAEVIAQKPVDVGDHHRIRCAWPTSLSDRNEAFDAMAVTYLGAVDAFNAKPAPGATDFNRVVDACLACHANMCAGPMVAIRPLRIPLPGEAPEPPKGMFE